MRFVDKLFGRSSVVTLGKQRYRNSAGEVIVVTKDIRYRVKDRNSTIYMYDQADVKQYCSRYGYKPIP